MFTVLVVKLFDFHLGAVPLENDVFSFEFPDFINDVFIRKDISYLIEIARSLKMFGEHGLNITEIKGIGQNSALVMDLFRQCQTQRPLEQPISSPSSARPPSPSSSPQQPHLLQSQAVKNENFIPKEAQYACKILVLERWIDYFTLFFSPLTYEALIDETIGIKAGFIDIDSSFIESDSEAITLSCNNGTKVANASSKSNINPEKKTVKRSLNSTDEVFEKIRNKHIRTVGSTLHDIAKQMESEVQQRSYDTLAQIGQFAKKLQSIQSRKISLAFHVKMASQLVEYTSTQDFHKELELQQHALLGCVDESDLAYLEECIFKKEPRNKVLKMLCLLCLTGSLKQDQLQFFKKEILQTYGYNQLLTLMNLEKIGLLVAKNKNEFLSLVKFLKLNNENVDEIEPNDIAYVFSRYAPLSVRLVEYELGDKKGWSSYVSNQAFSRFVQSFMLATLPPRNAKDNSNNAINEYSVTISNTVPSTVVVLLLGGLTYSEVAAFRLISNKRNINFILMTTKLVNSNNIFSQI
jgi:hypothetical protein